MFGRNLVSANFTYIIQSYLTDYPIASDAALNNMDKCTIKLHIADNIDLTQTNHNKTVCIWDALLMLRQVNSFVACSWWRHQMETFSA